MKSLILSLILVLFAEPFRLANPQSFDDESDYYVKYASFVFQADESEPRQSQFKRELVEDKQLELSANNANLKEGDIFVHEQGDSNRVKRKIVGEFDAKTRVSMRWPNNIVVYEIANDFPADMINRLNKAIEHWHKYTCIRFERYEPIRHQNYRCVLRIQNSNICGAYIGYITMEGVKTYRSPVFLGRVCSVGNIIHELGHTVGFNHEQTRYDRDAHVEVDYNRIERKLYEQYAKMSYADYFNVQYDLFSIMHYSSNGGVLKSRDPRRNFLMGQRSALSFLDIQLANAAFKCAQNCPNVNTCKNGAFLLKDCTCFCPDGTTGQFCESVVQNAPLRNSKLQLKSSAHSSLDCDFENETLCLWSNDKLRSSEEWSFSKLNDYGYTEAQVYFRFHLPYIRTGPQHGDRNNNRKNKYIYLNSMKRTSASPNAILTSPKIEIAEPSLVCIKFWYHMFQSGISAPDLQLNIGTLSLNLKFSNGSTSVLWSKSGNQSEEWQNANVQVELLPPATSIYFEASLVDWNMGDIALDDIVFKRGSCSIDVSGFTPWSAWSKCSNLCGKGTQSRNKECEDRHKPCMNSLIQLRDCESFELCPRKIDTKTTQSSDHTLEKWSDWSDCSSKCGPGQQIRRIICLSIDAQNDCDVLRQEIRDCYGEKCDKAKESIAKPDKRDEESSQLRTLSVLKSIIGRNKRESSMLELTQNNLPVIPNHSIPNNYISNFGTTACGGSFVLDEVGKKLLLTSPNYPDEYPSNLRCNFLIKTSIPGKRLSLEGLDLDLEQTGNTCVDGLELRYFSLGQPGPIFCGTLSKQNQLKVETYSNFLMIVFRSDWGHTKSRRGFYLEIKIIS